MKGLILKDIYVLTRQMRIFLFIILLFTIIPSNNLSAFAVIYAAMMPYTALAYDERSHWDQLAAMMPYSMRDIVMSKYILGWLFTGATSLIALAAVLIERNFISNTSTPIAILLSFCIALILMAITLPLMFRFGVEKGRLIFMLVIMLGAIGSVGLISGLATAPAEAAPMLRYLYVILPAIAVILTAISIPISAKLYQSRHS